jgi:hypothetical protein
VSLIEDLAREMFKKSNAHILALVLIRKGSPVTLVYEEYSIVGPDYYRTRLAPMLRELAASIEADEEGKEK